MDDKSLMWAQAAVAALLARCAGVVAATLRSWADELAGDAK